MAGGVTLAPGVDDAGLAAMLAGLIRQNIEQHPGKSADFRRLSADIVITVPDAEVTVTLEFGRGELIVHEGERDGARDGHRAGAQLGITANSDTLLALPLVKISAGLPNLFARSSSALLRGLFDGSVKISGMLRHPVTLIRFTRLMSVNG